MKQDLRGKRATVLGLGRSGRSAAGLLGRLGAEVFISDRGQPDQTALEWLEKNGFRHETGGHTEKALKTDLLVVSPGVRTEDPFLASARERKIEIIGEIELAYRATEARIVAVTGTNGKSTTTSMIGHVLNLSSFRCLVGGNLAPGRPMCDLASEAAPGDIITAEVSSFQLETISRFRPGVAVITNITADHLDRHPDLGTYACTKARIFENQGPEDFAVLNRDDANIARFCRPGSKVLGFSRAGRTENGAWADEKTLYISSNGSEREIMAASELTVPGGHNVENALAAAAACAALGCRAEAIGRALRTFAGVPHRLEEVAVVGGVRYVNNSMCTNPAAGASSLRAFREQVVVIAGGREKGLDMGPYLEAIAQKAEAAVLLGESRAGMVAGLRKLGFGKVHQAESLAEAVDRATALAKPGWVVLFSPGGTSFDMFRDFEHRGEAFRAEVERLKR